jgi:hypothetical protein
VGIGNSPVIMPPVVIRPILFPMVSVVLSVKAGDGWRRFVPAVHPEAALAVRALPTRNIGYRAYGVRRERTT